MCQLIRNIGGGISLEVKAYLHFCWMAVAAQSSLQPSATENMGRCGVDQAELERCTFPVYT